MVSSGSYFPQGAVVGISNIGAFTPAALEMVSDGSAFASAALEMVSDSGTFAPAAAVGKFSARFSLLLAGIYWGFAPYPPPSFLPLMEEKKAKEDQGVRDAGQVFRVPGQTSLPRQGTPGTLAKLAGYVRELDNLFFHNAQRQLRIDGAQQPHRGEDVAPI